MQDSRVGSYPSTEKQSVYFTALVEWAKRESYPFAVKQSMYWFSKNILKSFLHIDHLILARRPDQATVN